MRIWSRWMPDAEIAGVAELRQRMVGENEGRLKLILIWIIHINIIITKGGWWRGRGMMLMMVTSCDDAFFEGAAVGAPHAATSSTSVGRSQIHQTTTMAQCVLIAPSSSYP